MGQASVDSAVQTVLEESGHLDVLIHNAGHMVLGPTEAFTPEQVAAVYDTNVVSTQRVNRAALTHLHAEGDGLVIWVGSTSSRGGTPPYLGPYFAAMAADDGAEEVFRLGDRIRETFYQRVGLTDLLSVSSPAPPKPIG